MNRVTHMLYRRAWVRTVPQMLTILTVNILVWPQNRGRSFLIL